MYLDDIVTLGAIVAFAFGACLCVYCFAQALAVTRLERRQRYRKGVHLD